MRIAVIPARGGSKRIPRKNIKLFHGKPILAWSIEAALESECFDSVIVSTDDDEIAEIARTYGASVPFARPLSLADDYTGTIPVIAHAIDWVNNNAAIVELACCIYATAPFVHANDIQRGLQVLLETRSGYAFSVTTFAFPIQRALRVTHDSRIEMLDPSHFNTRSQDLDEAWHDAGQFYWGTANTWLSGTPIFSHVAAPVPIPRYRVQDMDTVEDWVRAEYMYKAIHLAK